MVSHGLKCRGLFKGPLLEDARGRSGKLGAALGSWGAAWCKMRRVMAKKAGGHSGSQGPLWVKKKAKVAQKRPSAMA